MNEIDTLIPAVTDEEAQTFCDGLTQYMKDARVARGITYPGSESLKVTFRRGGRWLRVFVEEPGSGYIYAIVDPTNGDIYKPTSYKGGPAKHVRGNIRRAHLGTVCQCYSVVYLR